MTEPFIGPNQYFTLSFPVFPVEANICALSFLQQRLPERDAQRLPLLFSQGMVSIAGRQITENQPIQPSQNISLQLPGHYEGKVNADWQTVWQNDELLAVYKPPLLPVSRTTRNLYNTLISLVRRHTSYQDARLLHRLDTETSGLMMLAKDGMADKKWKSRLNQLIVEKRYHAWVYGEPKWEKLTFEAELSERDDSQIRSQVYVVDPDKPEHYLKPKLSKSEFKVLKRNKGFSLIECQLMTGRKHQIRAHLSHLGHPLVGDKIYAHEGRFYLKRLKQALTYKDQLELVTAFQQLSCVALTLNLGETNLVIESNYPLRSFQF